MKDTVNLNPRYLAYCRSKGNTPEQQSQIDLVDYPGGKMTGFILWTKQHWMDFYRENELDPNGIYSGIQEEFDKWLNNKYPIKNG